MTTHKAAQLEQALTTLQQRWGQQAVCTLREAPAPEGIPTGFPALDALTGTHGIPAGCIVALSGAPTSGATTLAYHLAASAQRGLRTAIWLDLPRRFDPASAGAAGIDFQHLLLSRPEGWLAALALIRDLAEHLLHTLLILDVPPRVTPEEARLLDDLLSRLPALCHRHDNTLLLLHSSRQPPTLALPRAALVLRLERIAWRPDMTGLTTRITLLKSRFAPAGHSTTLEITYPEWP